MKKFGKLTAAALTLGLLLTQVSVFASGTDYTDDTFYSVVFNEDFSGYSESAAESLPSLGAGDIDYGYLKESDGNICCYGYRATAGSGWKSADLKVPSDKNKLNDSAEGEYITEVKVKYVASNIGQKMAEFNKKFTIAGKEITTSISQIVPNGSTEGVVNLGGTELGKVKLSANTWYTVRNTYNLENKSGRVEIVSPNGTVFDKTCEISFDGSGEVKVSWDNCLIYGSVTPNAGNGVLFDDILLAKVTHKPVTVNYDTEKGAVTYGGNAVANGAETPVEYNKDAEFTVEAKDGYEVDSVSVDGNSITLNAQGAFTVSKVLSAKTVNVVFKAAEPVAPSVVKTNVISNGTYEGEAAAVVYAKVTGEVSETGIVLKDKDGNALTLPAMKDADSKLTSGSFAIRVFGDAMKSGETYKFAPYIEYEGGSYTADDESFVLGQ